LTVWWQSEGSALAAADTGAAAVAPDGYLRFHHDRRAIFNAVTDKASPADSDHSDGRYQPGLSALSAIVKVLEVSVADVDAGTMLRKLANPAPGQRI